jgi:hypothetical protein
VPSRDGKLISPILRVQATGALCCKESDWRKRATDGREGSSGSFTCQTLRALNSAVELRKEERASQIGALSVDISASRRMRPLNSCQSMRELPVENTQWNDRGRAAPSTIVDSILHQRGEYPQALTSVAS